MRANGAFGSMGKSPPHPARHLATITQTLMGGRARRAEYFHFPQTILPTWHLGKSVL